MQKDSPLAAPEQLTALVKTVAQAVATWIEQGHLTRVRTAVRVRDPGYRDGSLIVADRTEDREYWDDVTLQKLVHKKFEANESKFERVMKVLAEEADITGNRVPKLRGDLGQFLVAVARQAAKDAAGLDAPSLADQFIHEIGGGELTWSGSVWLKGLVVEGDPLKIGNGTTLRQPIADDFAFEVPAETAMFRSGAEDLMRSPNSVLEMSRRAINRPDHDAYRITNSLCLYDLGAVTPIKIGFNSDSLFRPSHTAWPHTLSNTTYRYKISGHDGPRLAKFVNRVSDRLPVKPTGTHQDKCWNGLKFYFRALFSGSDPEERLTLGIGSLESILLSGIQHELKFRLSQRTAVLLRLAELDSLQVFTDMKKAYDVRSRYAHGEQSSEEPHELQALCTRVMNYARLAVLKALDVDQEMSQQDLGTSLDQALLDNGVREDLQTKLRGGLWELARSG